MAAPVIDTPEPAATLPSEEPGSVIGPMAWIRALCVLMILFGIAGVVVGDTSAAAGWWLVVVFSTLLLLTFVDKLRQARATKHR